ncbi:XrtA/PEP-CTERM system TPR-repeat protein PrsT [Citrifermentans bremense]|uniref:XrtA/PEP-CTERM system TPR-repeat protein PrsT n=1 Tax=Citrifermentans bremense TaxID=60035 RepID=UPI001CF77457|nr:XrtA/PEP-CTERM system TPR-repeat protein PrsT [Citrifermentans bremense]
MKKFCLACVILLTCVGCSSKTKESLYNEGKQQMEASNPGAAVVFFKNALEKDGNYLEARFQLAKAYAALGKNEQAEKEFTKVLTQNPTRDEVLLELAKLNNAAGKGDQGFRYATQYLAKHSGAVDGLEAAGISCLVSKKHQEAREYLTQALRVDPSRSATKLELASVDMATGDTERAKALLNEVILAEQKNFKALYMLAAIENNSGHGDKAATLYQKILQLDQNQVHALYKLGLLYLERGEVDKADQSADQMMKAFPKKGDGYRLKGLAAFYRKRFDDAITSLQQSVKLSPTLEAYHFLGLSYYSKGELENALSQFRVVLDRVPEARKSRLMTAQTLLAQKRTEDGIAEIKKVLASDDNDAVAHNLLGGAYMSQGLFEEGMRELNLATKLDPKMVNAHLKKGAFYFSKGRYTEGETELATAVQAAPDAQNSRLLLASYYQSQKKPAKALSTLKSGLKGGKGDAPLYNAIASLQFSGGNKAEGIKTLEQAKRVDPGFAATYQNLAGVYAATGDYPRAMAELNQLLARDAGNLRALLGLAALSEISGKESDAVAYYQKATQTKAPEAFLALAGYHQKKGNAAKAIAVLDEEIKLDPRAISALEAKGRILASQKEYQKALKVFDQVEALNEERGVALKIGAYVAMNDSSKAVEQAGRLIAKRPGSSQGYLLLATVHQSLRNIPAAINEVNKAIRADGKSVEARIALGNLYQATKEYDKALASYQYAQRMNPDSVAAQFAIGALYDSTGKKNQAADAYRAVLQKNDRYVPALNNLAYLCADGYGSKEEALRLAISAFKQQPGNPGVMDTVGYALAKNGRSADAVKVMERAVALLPNDPTVRYHLGLAYYLAGDRARSEQALQKSLSLGQSPDTKAAQTLLAELKR